MLDPHRHCFVETPDPIISSVEEIDTFSFVDFRPCFFIFLLPTLWLFAVVHIEAVEEVSWLTFAEGDVVPSCFVDLLPSTLSVKSMAAEADVTKLELLEDAGAVAVAMISGEVFEHDDGLSTILT